LREFPPRLLAEDGSGSGAAKSTVHCISYKPAPHQKISQQTCDPNELEGKGPKACGSQLSLKDISSVIAEPTHGWNEQAATMKIVFV
jgi:hypothetical protein